MEACDEFKYFGGEDVVLNNRKKINLVTKFATIEKGSKITQITKSIRLSVNYKQKHRRKESKSKKKKVLKRCNTELEK